MLCKECQTIFNVLPTFKEGYWFAGHRYTTSWDMLELSTAICYICHLYSDEILRVYTKPWKECQIKIDSGLMIYDGKSQDDVNLSSKIELEGQTRSAHILVGLFSVSAHDLSNAIIQKGISSTGSTSSINFARSCLAKCATKHSLCRTGQNGQLWYPTRLIEIRASNDHYDPTGFTAKLVNTNFTKPDGSYCSLSHCWGKVKLFMLLKDNMTQLHHELDLSLLPRTFLDAMKVAMFLNVHYIWIDTLCIVQDSPEDWRYEASRMFEVYLHAYLNIAATKAANATEGLFAERSQESVIAIVQLKHGPRPGIYQLLDQKYWFHMVDNAILNKRAWVLQEKLLSSRTLHFTDDQLIWDCCESIHFEAFRDELGTRSQRLIGPVGPKYNQNLLSMHKRDAENGDKWLDVVHSYSKSLLTFQSDKLHALSGLVKQFERLLGDSYCAGMWRKTMLFHLTWYVRQPTSNKRRPGTNRAPSWSWLAYDGEVLIPTAEQTPGPHYDRIKLAEILNIDVVQAHSNDGDIFEGCLDLRAFLTPLSSDRHVGLKLTAPVLSPFRADQVQLTYSFEYDVASSRSTPEPFFYVPIWCLLYNATTMKFLDGCDIHGLIVRVKDKEPLIYERCAHACLHTTLTEPLRGCNSYFEALVSAEQTFADEGGGTQTRSLHQSTMRLV